MTTSLLAIHEHDRHLALRQRWPNLNDLEPPAPEPTGAIREPERLSGLGTALPYTRPRAIVLDDFLTPAAFQRLQEYFLYGNIWRAVAPAMLAARQLAECPLLRQIVAELRQGASALFAPHPHESYWGFKSLLPNVGTGLHADAASLTANLWLTDNSANLDPAAGGLVVWDATPPTTWSLPDYNAQGDEHQAVIQRYLDEQTPFRLHIPYRANRCVIFASPQFHASDRVHFADSFAARRMNLTLLFS